MITCQEPEVPTGGYVVGYDFNIHSSIEYHCDAGHKLIGTSILQCNNNGEWSATPPECQCEHNYKLYKTYYIHLYIIFIYVVNIEFISLVIYINILTLYTQISIAVNLHHRFMAHYTILMILHISTARSNTVAAIITD